MNCPRCGKEMPEGARLCAECSAAMRGEQPAWAEPEPVRRFSGLAIASLALGILGLLPLFGLVALGLGIAALVGISRSQGRLRGQGLAIAGVALGGAGTLLQVAMVALLLPAFTMARRTAQTTTCLANARQAGLAFLIYAEDHGGRLPSAERWQDELAEYLKNPRVFDCPSQPGSRNFAFNRMLAGKRTLDLAAPQDTVLIVDAGMGLNASGGPELLGVPPHRASARGAGARRWVVCFADGHVRTITREELASCRWEP